MPSILMETDLVLSVAKQLEKGGNEIHFFNEILQKMSSNLSMSWTGENNSAAFFDEFNNLIASFERHGQSLQNLGMRLTREVDEWIEADGKADFANIRFSPLPIAPFEPIINGITSLFGATLTRAAEYIKNSESGKELIELAFSYGLCFVFPDGSFIGDPNGKSIQIKYASLQLTEGGFYSTNAEDIAINSILRLSTDKELAGTLAHEMQHAIDDEKGVILTSTITSSSQQELEAQMSQVIKTRAEEEIRAYTRGNSVMTGTPYADDGIYTNSEIFQFFKDHPAYLCQYKDYLKGILPSNYLINNFTISKEGEIQVVLQSSENVGSFEL